MKTRGWGLGAYPPPARPSITRAEFRSYLFDRRGFVASNPLRMPSVHAGAGDRHRPTLPERSLGALPVDMNSELQMGRRFAKMWARFPGLPRLSH